VFKVESLRAGIHAAGDTAQMLRSQEHEVWLRAVYKSMPRQLESLDSNRLTLLYFLASERCIRPSDPFLLQTPAPGALNRPSP
jgi:hypothetical protein